MGILIPDNSKGAIPLSNMRTNGYPDYSAGGRQCKCCPTVSPLPHDTAVAMAYVPFQQWCEPYGMEKALIRGTLFPVLDKPFMGGRCR